MPEKCSEKGCENDADYYTPDGPPDYICDECLRALNKKWMAMRVMPLRKKMIDWERAFGGRYGKNWDLDVYRGC